MNPTQPTILLVEDDPNLRLALRDSLEHQGGYAVEEAASVREAREHLARGAFQLILLDVMLPDGDGYTLCRSLREEGVTSPVLMLTARTLEDDVVRGFEAGAQDYLGKPYRLRELLARVGALVRRAGGGAPAKQVRFGGYRMDLDRRKLETPEGANVELTRTEFDLLAFLVRERERVLRRDDILDAVWGRDIVVDPHTVDNFVSSLKKKLGWNSASRFAIQTVRGVGYRMEIEAP
ncbi:response regulator transcription factor [Myxococcus sp. CA051A]|uniref:Response regulator transcription factor n=1 Tax=Myxococcus llanfairpwllgwyngyllgogerychwyrndrobwllllantysiliogogogochensis TaxID=2590453 RepID=A0A540X278_9BACT|nr:MULTISPECIES: response regulator transcription factor [Myxococcus]NTX03381.1 response regulator transcription factor [Myxococcus sp. CA040A]NTX34108.1 response regulator transcription factor [Myxococcus sp. CA033]NTX50918.1 response regulator transcription factor [Myxococcus sp. CA039A]NTX65707.1 response regulator transcription factor [Myxococcus sp. CA051A]TQF15359.1 response regulator transcription factor [Myxococcus llanfairpwllgwyngyllgogerychwyrndrobwllllantysiliogogogochensis]